MKGRKWKISSRAPGAVPQYPVIQSPTLQTQKRILSVATLLMLALIVVLALTADHSATWPELPGDNPEEAYVAAQAILASGQSEMIELSHQATVVSQSIDQATASAA